MTIEQKVNAANAKVVEILTKARPAWVDVQPALDVIPGMTPNMVLVPGPPLPVEQITTPIRTSICGAAVHEKLAKTKEEAWDMVLRGEITVASAQAVEVGVSARVVLEPGAALTAVETAFTALLDGYLADAAFEEFTVYHHRVGALLMSVEGVLDYEGLALNGGGDNLALDSNQVPVRGKVVLTCAG